MSKNFEKQILHLPFEKPDAYKAIVMPVYTSSAFEFDTAEEMESAFCGKTTDHVYSRVSNPTVRYFEERVRSVTGALSVTALNSGMAAINNTLSTIGYSGANIVTSPCLFGNTYSLFMGVMAAFAVNIRFCDLNNIDEVRSNIDSNTCAVFAEAVSNPQLEVVDIRGLSNAAHECLVPLVLDTTVIPFACGFNAKDYGVDIEIVSGTKYISGGATSTGGLIIDYGTFNWEHSKVLKPWNLQYGNNAFTARIKKEVCRNLGAYMTANAASVQMQCLETLCLRYERQSLTCLKLAHALQKISKKIVSVNYPGLECSPYYQISKQQFGNQPGALLTFDLPSREAAFSLINNVKIIRRATNMFDNKTLIIHPASTIYGTYNHDQRKTMKVNDQMVRLSVGLESADDLINDIQQALEY